MFWLQNRIAQFAYLRYNHIGKEVRENVDKHELEMIKAVEAADAAALELGSDKKVVKYLTNFSIDQAAALFKKWNNLDKYLLIKYIDGNTKHQNADGSFKNNGHCTTIPPAPMFPGYSDTYKRAVVNEK